MAHKNLSLVELNFIEHTQSSAVLKIIPCALIIFMLLLLHFLKTEIKIGHNKNATH